MKVCVSSLEVLYDEGSREGFGSKEASVWSGLLGWQHSLTCRLHYSMKGELLVCLDALL